MAKQERLPVKLTEREKMAKADDQAAKVLELERMEQQHKELKKEMKEREDALKLQIRKLAMQIDTGSEDRLVDVEEVPSLGERLVHTYRQDTGALVRSRPMTPAEMAEAQQERIPGVM